jgi:hypothetical protein
VARESKFLESIERARAAATQPARPEEKPVGEMSSAELDVALEEARREAIAANRAVAEAATAERTRPATLAATLAELQRGKRKSWR